MSGDGTPDDQSMDGEGLVETLQGVGLSPYQAKAYVALLDMGTGSAVEVAQASGVPDPRIYDVLRDLEAEGYVETYEQDSLRARARDPSEVIETLESRAAEFESATEAIADRWEAERIEEAAVSVVRRFDTVLREAERAVESAEYHVRACVSQTNLSALAPALEAAAERGVQVNLTLHTPEGGDRPDDARVASLATEARYRPLPSPFLVLVDRSKTCFFPHSETVETFGALVNDPAYAHVFHWFFVTQLWADWERLTRGEDPSPREYVDVRECIADLTPLVDDGARIEVEVEGVEVDSGTERTVTGVVDSVTTHSAPDGDRRVAPAVQYAGVAAVTVDTGDGLVDVGGWGATVEELEVRRIRVVDVQSPEDATGGGAG